MPDASWHRCDTISFDNIAAKFGPRVGRIVADKADISSLISPVHGLRFYDLRHHAITELAESQASDATIMSGAGHVSPKMLAHYSYVHIETK